MWQETTGRLQELRTMKTKARKKMGTSVLLSKELNSAYITLACSLLFQLILHEKITQFKPASQDCETLRRGLSQAGLFTNWLRVLLINMYRNWKNTKFSSLSDISYKTWMPRALNPYCCNYPSCSQQLYLATCHSTPQPELTIPSSK